MFVLYIKKNMFDVKFMGHKALPHTVVSHEVSKHNAIVKLVFL